MSSTKPFNLRFSHTQRETPTVLSFFFNVESGALNFRAGNYLILRFRDLADDPRGPMRQFSIASSPSESGSMLRIATTIEPDDSPFKRRLNGLKPSEPVEALGPFGSFTIDEARWKDSEVVLVGAGIGVTPLRSMLFKAAKLQLDSNLKLIHLARDPSEFVFAKEFDSLSSSYSRLNIWRILSSPRADSPSQHVGSVELSALSGIVEEMGSALFYLSGPAGIVHALSQALSTTASVPHSNIRTERFTGY